MSLGHQNSACIVAFAFVVTQQLERGIEKNRFQNKFRQYLSSLSSFNYLGEKYPIQAHYGKPLSDGTSETGTV